MQVCNSPGRGSPLARHGQHLPQRLVHRLRLQLVVAEQEVRLLVVHHFQVIADTRRQLAIFSGHR